MDEITLADVMRTADEVVDEFGEGYVYEHIILEAGGSETCAYMDRDGNPSCIVGHILHRLGVPLPEPQSFNNTIRIASLVHGGDVFVTDDVKWFLHDMQSRQDVGKTWGDAVAHAKHNAGGR